MTQKRSLREPKQSTVRYEIAPWPGRCYIMTGPDRKTMVAMLKRQYGKRVRFPRNPTLRLGIPQFAYWKPGTEKSIVEAIETSIFTQSPLIKPKSKHRFVTHEELWGKRKKT